MRADLSERGASASVLSTSAQFKITHVFRGQTTPEHAAERVEQDTTVRTDLSPCFPSLSFAQSVSFLT